MNVSWILNFTVKFCATLKVEHPVSNVYFENPAITNWCCTYKYLAEEHSLGRSSSGWNSPSGDLRGWDFLRWEFTRWKLNECSFAAMLYSPVFSFYLNFFESLNSKYEYLFFSTGASDRIFYPFFNKRYGHLEKLMAVLWPKTTFSAGSLCGPLVSSPQSKCPKRTFILPQKYQVSVSNMLS